MNRGRALLGVMRKKVPLVLWAVALAACTAGQPSPSAQSVPDLLPVPLAGVEGYQAFCDIDDGALRVTVRNEGSADAGPSETRVAFDYSSRIDPADTPAITAGAEAEALVPLPQPVPGEAFDFTITVDAGNGIAESDEADNFGEGQCPADLD